MRPKDLFGIVETLAKEGHGAKRVCRILAVAPSGFFSWRTNAPSDRAIRRAWLTDLIIEVHDKSRRTYGWRRVRAELADAYGQMVNKKLIQAIMAEQGISGLPSRRKGKSNLLHRLTDRGLRQPGVPTARSQPAVDDRRDRTPDRGKASSTAV